jgi:hypothetical protein
VGNGTGNPALCKCYPPKTRNGMLRSVLRDVDSIRPTTILVVPAAGEVGAPPRWFVAFLVLRMKGMAAEVEKRVQPPIVGLEDYGRRMTAIAAHFPNAKVEVLGRHARDEADAFG